MRAALRGLLAAGMVWVGIKHFTAPEFFVRIVPAALPAPLLLVHVSGVFEILGGVGLLVPRTRRFASWGLIALFVAIFPANINMAMNDIQPDPSTHIPMWAQWARLPLQALLIAWAYYAGGPHKRAIPSSTDTTGA